MAQIIRYKIKAVLKGKNQNTGNPKTGKKNIKWHIADISLAPQIVCHFGVCFVIINKKNDYRILDQISIFEERWSVSDERTVYSSLRRSITFSMRSWERSPEFECCCCLCSSGLWPPQQPIPPLRERIRYTIKPIKSSGIRFCILLSSIVRL